MNKTFLRMLLGTLCALCALNTSAQIRFGIKGGANFSKMPLSIQEIKSNNMLSYHLGVTAEYQAKLLPLSVEASVLLSQKGSAFEEGALKSIFSSNNIEVPMHLRLWIFSFGKSGLFVQGGPYFSYRLSHNANEVAQELSKLKTLDPQRIGYGMSLGAGIEVLDHLQLSVQWAAPLSKEYRYTIPEAIDEYRKSTQKSLSISAALLF